jgi:hypothetical protein
MPQSKRVLRNLKISEVSTVDKAANQHARVAFWKRDDDLGRKFRKIFGCPSLRDMLDKAERNPSLPRLRDLDPPRDPDVDVIDPDEEADDEEGDADETEDTSKHFVSVLADLLVEGGGALFPDRPSALHYLMRTAHGSALVRRLHHQKKLNKQKERTMTTTRAEELSAIAKKYGPVAVAKHIIENGASISEHEFTAMVDAYAKANGTTFVKLYTALDDDGLAIRKATQVLKSMPFPTAAPRLQTPTPPRVGAEAARSVDNP